MSHFQYGLLQHSVNRVPWNTDGSFVQSRMQQCTQFHPCNSTPMQAALVTSRLPDVIQDVGYRLLKSSIKHRDYFVELPVASNFDSPHQILQGRHAQVTSMKQCNPVGSRKYAFLIMVPTLKNSLPPEIWMALTLLALQKAMKTW